MYLRTHTGLGKAPGAVAIRDMFHKEMVNNVRGVKKGVELKKGWKIASDKLISEGSALIPVLRAGNSLIGIPSESLVLCPKMSE